MKRRQISLFFEHYHMNDAIVVIHIISGRRFCCRVDGCEWVVNEICSDGVTFLLSEDEIDAVGEAALEYAQIVSDDDYDPRQ